MRKAVDKSRLRAKFFQEPKREKRPYTILKP